MLAGLGRRHVPQAARTIAAAVAGAGFATWNLDLIFGAATESDDDWAATLEDVLALAHPPPHLSAYGLTVEPGTPLAADPHAPSRRRRRRPGATSMTDAVLTSAPGTPGRRSPTGPGPGTSAAHNHLYWEQGDYVGIGSAAHSHRDGVRWWNVRTPDRYVEAVEAGRSPEAGREVLTPDQRAFEALSLVAAHSARRALGSLERPEELDGLVERVDGRAVLTVRGRLLANEVSARIRSGILHR